MVIIEYLWHVIKQALLILAIGFLPYLIFALLMQKISNVIRTRLAALMGIKGYIYTTAPGVMIHELSHAFFCILFGHKVVEMKLFSPEADGTLGYVNHSYNPKNKFQRIGNFFIGTGPIWGGVAVLYFVTLLLLPSGVMNFDLGMVETFFRFLGYICTLDFWCRWQSYVWLYLVLTVSSHITLSPPDLAGAKDGAIVLVATVFLLELLLGWCTSLNTSVANALNQWGSCIASILSLFLLLMLLWALVLVVFIKRSR